jgi:hypothetical protein
MDCNYAKQKSDRKPAAKSTNPHSPAGLPQITRARIIHRDTSGREGRKDRSPPSTKLRLGGGRINRKSDLPALSG